MQKNLHVSTGRECVLSLRALSVHSDRAFSRHRGSSPRFLFSNRAIPLTRISTCCEDHLIRRHTLRAGGRDLFVNQIILSIMSTVSSAPFSPLCTTVLISLPPCVQGIPWLLLRRALTGRSLFCRRRSSPVAEPESPRDDATQLHAMLFTSSPA